MGHWCVELGTTFATDQAELACVGACVRACVVCVRV